MIKSRDSSEHAWVSAAREVGIELTSSELGPVASGQVNDHTITISPVTGRGRKARKSTQYVVQFASPEAPPFRLIKRIDGDFPTVDTGHPKFDALVAVQTSDPEQFASFMTTARRAAILRMFTYWPNVLFSNQDVHITTAGIEDDHDALVDAICHLVATAETFDRLSNPPEPEPVPAMAGTPLVDVPQVSAPQI